MPRQILPAASLRSANRLPAARTLFEAANYLICTALSSIGRTVLRVAANFLPALRERCVTVVRSLLDPGPQPDPLILDRAILLHHDGVGAIRHRRSGEDPDRLAAPSAAAERMARRRPSGDRKHGTVSRSGI